MSNFWVAQWLDDNEIHNDWEIDHRLRAEDGIQSLHDHAYRACEDVLQDQYAKPAQSELIDSIVAGRSLDMSGAISCLSYDCMREDIDQTFKNVWHYFDSIVVEGFPPTSWLRRYRSSYKDPGEVLAIAASQARIVLYLRSVGAEDSVLYAHKSVDYCQECWLKHAKTLGIGAAMDERQRNFIIKRIVETSDIAIEPWGEGVWSAQINSRYFDAPARGESYHMRRPNMPTQEEVARSLVDDFAMATISDMELASELSLPLLEPTQIRLPLRGSRSGQKSADRSPKGDHSVPQPTISDVVLNLQLPVFDRLATRDFLRIREDERPYFEAYRGALRAAITDKLASQLGGSSAVTIARSIDEEYLRPGLADIERRVRTNRQAVIKKTLVDLSIGAAAAGVAALSSMPLMITGGVAALGSSVPLAPTINSYIEDKRNAKMSDLYFLWKIRKHANHR